MKEKEYKAHDGKGSKWRWIDKINIFSLLTLNNTRMKEESSLIPSAFRISFINFSLLFFTFYFFSYYKARQVDVYIYTRWKAEARSFVTCKSRKKKRDKK